MIVDYRGIRKYCLQSFKNLSPLHMLWMVIIYWREVTVHAFLLCIRVQRKSQHQQSRRVHAKRICVCVF